MDDNGNQEVQNYLYALNISECPNKVKNHVSDAYGMKLRRWQKDLEDI